MSESYTSDADGQRVSRTRSGVKTVYGGGWWEEDVPSGTVRTFYQFHGETIAQRSTPSSGASKTSPAATCAIKEPPLCNGVLVFVDGALLGDHRTLQQPSLQRPGCIGIRIATSEASGRGCILHIAYYLSRWGVGRSSVVAGRSSDEGGRGAG